MSWRCARRREIFPQQRGSKGSSRLTGIPRFFRRQWRNGELAHGRPGGEEVLEEGGNGRGRRGLFIGGLMRHKGQGIVGSKGGGMAITRSNARGVSVQRRKNVSVLTPRARMSAWERERRAYRFGF
jgi:hypothetical protein